MLQAGDAIDTASTIFIPVSAVIAIVFGLWLWKRVSAVSVSGRSPPWPRAPANLATELISLWVCLLR